MGKVISGDYSGCSIRANKKSLKIEYVSVSNPIDKRNIVEHQVIDKTNEHTQVKVKYVNNRYEKNSILQLNDKEFQVLMIAIEEKRQKPVIDKFKSVQTLTKTQKKVKEILKCQHCQEAKPRDQFTIVNVKPSAYCNSCNEEMAREREERSAKNGETALWRLIGFESKSQYITDLRDEYVKWKDGYEIVTSGKWKTMMDGKPSSYRWKGRVFRHNGGWMATSRNGTVKVSAKTRDEATGKLLNAIYRGALTKSPQPKTSKPMPIKTNSSGFWAAIKSVLGFKKS
jgi:hypothetical protein